MNRLLTRTSTSSRTYIHWLNFFGFPANGKNSISLDFTVFRWTSWLARRTRWPFSLSFLAREQKGSTSPWVPTTRIQMFIVGSLKSKMPSMSAPLLSLPSSHFGASMMEDVVIIEMDRTLVVVHQYRIESINLDFKFSNFLLLQIHLLISCRRVFNVRKEKGCCVCWTVLVPYFSLIN